MGSLRALSRGGTTKSVKNIDDRPAKRSAENNVCITTKYDHAERLTHATQAAKPFGPPPTSLGKLAKETTDQTQHGPLKPSQTVGHFQNWYEIRDASRRVIRKFT